MDAGGIAYAIPLFVKVYKSSRLQEQAVVSERLRMSGGSRHERKPERQRR